MPLSELEEYYRNCRAKAYENGEPIKGIRWRRKLLSVLISVFRIRRIISKGKLYVIGDKHIETGKPFIYACTHIGWNDAEMTFAAIKSHA